MQYDLKKERVKQYLGSISSLYDFEGSFDDAIAFLNKEKEWYNKEYVENAKTICEGVGYGRGGGYGGYADGTNKKTVRFDKIYLTVGEKRYEEGQELQIVGERDMLTEEINALVQKMTQEKASAEERERKQLEELKKKYEKT